MIRARAEFIPGIATIPPFSANPSLAGVLVFAQQSKTTGPG